MGMGNDFTSEDWSSIRRSENIVASYFIYKELKYDADKGSVLLSSFSRHTSRIGARSSVEKYQRRWSLTSALSEGAKVVGFADIIAVVVAKLVDWTENRSKNKPIKTEI